MNTLTDGQKQRKHWMSTLSRALPEEVEQAWDNTVDKPEYSLLRVPQMGLAMVRGKTGETGHPFNLGEITMTRATVRLASGKIGHGYVAGRRARHAELCAVFDALAQEPDRREDILSRVVGQLEANILQRKQILQRQTGATKVEFFTLVRGD